MRTKRRYAHELYPHADEYETRPLAVEVPYLYARFVGFDVYDTGWFAADPAETGPRIERLIDAARIALLADALHQGMTGDAAWKWADERIGDGNEIAWERAEHYGVPTRDIKPYPCGPTPADHRHYGPPDARGWRTVAFAPGPEDDCPDCTEPDPTFPPQVEQLDLGDAVATPVRPAVRTNTRNDR